MNNIRLCFRKINRWAQGYVARRTKDTGLTPSQIQALRHIGYHQVMSQQELVEDMGVDKAAVTRLVAGLDDPTECGELIQGNLIDGIEPLAELEALAKVTIEDLQAQLAGINVEACALSVVNPL